MAKWVKYEGNIYIWEATVPYRREVERYLTLVKTTHAGRTLVKHVSRQPRWMLISPFKPTRDDPVNAYASPKRETLADAYPDGYVGSTIVDVPLLGLVPLPVFGTGKGSVANVYYHPATWRQLMANTGRIDPGSGPGEVLFHEMLHGYRMQTGKLRLKDQVADNPHMHNVEEFYAVAASNVYRSERGFTKLRGDYNDGFKRLAHAIDDSDSYYENFKSDIDKWFTEQRPFLLDLAASPAKFNPFRSAAVTLGLIPAPTTSLRLP